MKHKLPVKLKDVAVFLETQSLLAFGNGGQDLGGLEWGRGHQKLILSFQNPLQLGKKAYPKKQKKNKVRLQISFQNN